MSEAKKFSNINTNRGNTSLSTKSRTKSRTTPKTKSEMFGGPPPALSSAELKAAETEATLTIQKIVVGAVLLYLSPFAIDAVKKLV